MFRALRKFFSCQPRYDSNLDRLEAIPTQEEIWAEQTRKLAFWVVYELGMGVPAPPQCRDVVLETMLHWVKHMMSEQEDFKMFQDKVRICHVPDFYSFCLVSNELFGLPWRGEETLSLRPVVIWARVIAIFAFAVKLAQKYNAENKIAEMKKVPDHLMNYTLEHLMFFLKIERGWEGMFKDYPPPPPPPVPLAERFRPIRRCLSVICAGLMITATVIGGSQHFLKSN